LSCGPWFFDSLVSLVFVVMLTSAALAPVAIRAGATDERARSSHTGLAWPTHFEDRPLKRLRLSPVEQRFAAQFPGQIGRFSDGDRNIIMRVVQQPTRLLHPAADCFRGLGYHVATPRVAEDASGLAWSCFPARKDGRSLRVCERIYDTGGQSWTDVSAWYWAALVGQTRAPWFTLTVAAPW
jgi:hypothetical protein